MLITALTSAATCPYPDPKYQFTSEAFCVTIRNNIRVYGKELLAPRPTPKVEDHNLSAVRDCLFNIFAATLPYWRPFLYPQPEDAPGRGDRDQLCKKICSSPDPV